MEPTNWQAARVCTQQKGDVIMSEVTITIKDVVDGDSIGVTLDCEVADDNIDSLAVYVSGAIARFVNEILDSDFAGLENDKVH